MYFEHVNIEALLLPLEEAIRTVLIPSITGQNAPNDLLRELFTLPCRLGGLGIPNLSQVSNEQYSNSMLVSSPLISLLLLQCHHIPPELYTSQFEAKQTIKSNRAQFLSDKVATIRDSLSSPLQKLFDITNEKGSSTWLSVVPLKSHGYHLNKGMLCVYDIVGTHLTYLTHVHVERRSR